jgi:Flp pilus assembly protein TadD
VIARRPEELGAYGRLGTCLTEVGRIPEAEATFAELRRRAPRSVIASNGLAAVALVTGRAEEARRQYQDSLQVDPANVQARRGLVVLAETVDANPAEALRLCQEIERLAPGDASTAECIRRNRARLDGGG